MVPQYCTASCSTLNSPRIRGDGPNIVTQETQSLAILPVFAGMVPHDNGDAAIAEDSPRIRGDGPSKNFGGDFLGKFSPYSRGWSGWLHAATVDGRDSPRIRGDGPYVTPTR